MNKCFFMGFVINNIDFQFIINGKHDSIVQFSIVLFNGSIIKIIAFDKLADFCYRKLKMDCLICVEGYLNQKIEVVADYIKVYR